MGFFSRDPISAISDLFRDVVLSTQPITFETKFPKLFGTEELMLTQPLHIYSVLSVDIEKLLIFEIFHFLLLLWSAF